MEIRDRREAIRALFGEGGRSGSGAIRTKDGTVYRGSLFDLESPINDPEGIGYFLLELNDGTIADIPYNEFDALIDVW